LSVQGTKRAIQLIVDDMAAARSRRAGDASEMDRLVTAAYESVDLSEGIAAMSEKREPRFRGT
jgi:hypothetical protein